MARRTSLHRFLWFTFAIFLVLAVNPLLAQSAAPLTGVAITNAGGFSLVLSYPDGWSPSTNDKGIYLASSQSALNELLQQGILTTAGDAGILIFLPSFLDNLNVARNAPADQTVSAYLKTTKTQGAVVASTDFTVPAATAMISPPDHADIKLLIGALAFPAGTVFFAVIPTSGDNATALAVLNSISLSGSSASPPQATEESTQSSNEPTAATFAVHQSNGDFQFAITLPSGWADKMLDDTLFIGNSQDALDKLTSSSPNFSAGEVGVTIALPSALDRIGISSTAKAQDALNQLITSTKTKGTAEEDDTFSVPAAHTVLTGDVIPSGKADAYGLAFDAGTVLVIVEPGGSVTIPMTVILHSIRFSPASGAATAELQPTEAPTTATHAAKPIQQWASSADGTSEYGTDDWSFAQATGKPDTQECGDNGTAWASEESTGRAVLQLTFDHPVIPNQINVYQTFNPGAIVEIDVGSTSNPNKVLPLPHSADAPGNTDCPGVFSLDVSGVDTPIDFVVLYLDQSLTQNWDEIDAVQLVGTPTS